MSFNKTCYIHVNHAVYTQVKFYLICEKLSVTCGKHSQLSLKVVVQMMLYVSQHKITAKQTESDEFVRKRMCHISLECRHLLVKIF